jgi:hypothetical protein
MFSRIALRRDGDGNRLELQNDAALAIARIFVATGARSFSPTAPGVGADGGAAWRCAAIAQSQPLIDIRLKVER